MPYIADNQGFYDLLPVILFMIGSVAAIVFFCLWLFDNVSYHHIQNEKNSKNDFIYHIGYIDG